MTSSSENLPAPAKPKPVPERPSPEEFRQRLDLTRKLIQAGLYDGQIKKAVSEKFGCTRKTVLKYLSVVRKEIAAEYTQEQTERHRGDALEFYRGVYSDPKVPMQARLRAMEDSVRLLGLEVPQEVRFVQQVDVSLRASIENVARHQLTEDELLKLIEAGDIARKVSETEEEGDG